MTDVSTTWAEVIFRVMWIVDRQLMVYIRLIVAVIGQFSHDVIGCWNSSQWLVRFDPCIVSVISVVVLLVKFVGGYSLMFVCSVNKSFVGRR